MVVDSATNNKEFQIYGYHDLIEKENPLKLKYLGPEDNTKTLNNHYYFPCIGDNYLREKAMKGFVNLSTTIADKSAVISKEAEIGLATYVGPSCNINVFAKIGNGVICNTGCIIEHECVIKDFSHIGPGSVLLGNVTIGSNTLIGANSTVLPGIKIGDNVIVGAGSVVTKDISSNSLGFGNPLKLRK